MTVWLRGDREVRTPRVPAVENDSLSFTLGRNDTDFATSLVVGEYRPWALGVATESSDDALARLEPLGAPERRGWLLVTRGTDAALWVYLDGVRLEQSPFPLARVLAGELFISSHGECA